MHTDKKVAKRSHRLVWIALSTFVLSGLATWFANQFLGALPLFPGFILLFIVIFIGVVFDIVGVAVTAAAEAPLHAAATDRVAGSRHAVRLVQKADVVANFANDLIGDIAGTVSGAVALALALRIITLQPNIEGTAISTVVVAATAALTVTGKALGKSFAIAQADRIVLWVGGLFWFFERLTGVSLLLPGKDNRRRRRNAKKYGR